MTHLTLFKKILFITLILSLLPLVTSSLILIFNLESTSARLTTEISDTADLQASESLQTRAAQVAESVADFLRQREGDLLFLSRTQLDNSALLSFWDSRRSEIWYRSGSKSAPQEIREQAPLYRSIAIINRDGRERTVIRDGIMLPPTELKNVSDPSQTEYLSENYFNRVKKSPGKIYVSHLTGFHLAKQEQLNGAEEPEDAYGGKQYQGVIRFAAATFDSGGNFNGAVVISLDHRHLMEFTQHIDPGHNFSTIFPSYKSGNYAFMFDDEGWIITHPKYWNLRGLDKNGTEVPPYSVKSTSEEIDSGKIPFNLDHAGFVHPNYPVASARVRQQLTGSVDTTNVGGARKIMAYAPIIYGSSDYSKYGVFGGITIGFQIDQFQNTARRGSRLINLQLGEHRTRSAIILMLTAALAAFSAWRLSRGITKPLLILTDGARKLAEGDIRNRVDVNSSGEIGELARTFNVMADELETRKNNLLATLEELQKSRLDILEERNFKTSVLESISSAIITISPSGEITSFNRGGAVFFGAALSDGSNYADAFTDWPGISTRISDVQMQKSGYGREPYNRVVDGEVTYYDFGLFPIGSEAEKGLTMTLRDETERERLREETVRLDRLASLGKLSAGIAHEVRNPLTGISLLLDDLHDKPGFSPDDRLMLSKALAEIERVERLISALLNYSSPARSNFRTGALDELLKDILLLMRRQAEKQGVMISVNAGRLPQFRFDAEKIRQAILNILKNALEVLENGGIITIEAEHTESSVTLSIHDNGPGIAENDISLIFEPFFTRKGAGTGLGLSITQRIIGEHRGTLSVESSRESGTTFRIVLPLAND